MIGFLLLHVNSDTLYNNHKINSENCHNFPRLAAVEKVIRIFKYKTVWEP